MAIRYDESISSRMIHQEFEPPEELRDFIKCFWYNRRDFGEGKSNFEVQPDGYVEIIFHFANSGCFLSDVDLAPLPSPFIMGLLNHPAFFHTQNSLEIIGVRCFPWAVFELLGLSLAKDKKRIIEHPIAQLQPLLNRLILAGEKIKAVENVKKYFMDAKSNVGARSMLFKAGIAMQKAKGTISVSEVAAAAHTTVRTLERNFKHSSGHSVKDVSGLMRFEQVRNKLWLCPDSALSDLAYEFGYADQPHLSREFKRYSGITPATFARKAKQRKKFLSDDFVVFVQS